MGKFHSMGMGASPNLADRQSFASGPSRVSMGNLPGADCQDAAAKQAAQYRLFMQFQQQQAAPNGNEGLQSESEAKQQANNASSGDATTSKRKDHDDDAENGPAKKPKTGFVAN